MQIREPILVQIQIPIIVIRLGLYVIQLKDLKTNSLKTNSS